MIVIKGRGIIHMAYRQHALAIIITLAATSATKIPVTVLTDHTNLMFWKNPQNVSRPVTASAADTPPTCSGVDDPVHIAPSEVHWEPARIMYAPGVAVRGSGLGGMSRVYRV
jgi:hypothetical protein